MIFNFRPNKGFTLIELIVVISLFSLLLLFAIPRFQGDVLYDNTKKASRWIILKVPALKEKALLEHKRYVLHISIDSNRLWTTHESMSPEELNSAELTGYELPADIKVLDVQYPDGIKISIGRADIFFYKKGYSDKAIINMANNDNEHVSFFIEPFLTHVRMHDAYVEFED